MRIRTHIISASLLVVAVVCTIFLTYILNKESADARNDLQHTIDQNQQLLKVMIAAPLYDGNLAELNADLDSFFMNPDMLEISLDENKGNIHLTRKRAAPALLADTIQQTFEITRGADQLGVIHTVYTTANIEQEIVSSRNDILMFSLAILLTLAIVIYYVAKGISRPIDRLTRAAQAMADGDLYQSIDGSRVQELGILANSFSRMRDAIQEKMTSLVENNIQLKQEIEQRQNAELERDRLNSIIEATSDLVSMSDPHDHILYLNKAGRKLLGMDIATNLDAVVSQIHPEWAMARILNEGLPTAIREGTWSGETAVLGKDGAEIPVSQVIISHKDEQGNVVYMSTIMRDITASRIADEKMRVSDERLRQAIDVSRIGIFDHDQVNETIYWSPEARNIYGWGNDEEVGLQAFLQSLHPADRERIGREIGKAHDPAGTGIFIVEHRIIRRDGVTRWINTHSRTFFEGTGNDRHPVRTIGATVDVTERRNAEEALRQLNEELEMRVEERTAQLAASRDDAERANHAKSEFLSRMSHELRTPLNAILGFGQLLAMEKSLPTEQADNVKEILHAGQHLLDLINEVLDLARIESGKFTISKEPLPLAPMVADCIALIRPLAEANHITITEAGSGCVDFVQADRTRLKQVLINLLSNAIKYNRTKGSIGIVCMPQGEWLQIRISDTGQGLSPAQQARLFTPFERLNADQTGIEGTGIGLALCKRLVEIMGGEIGIESTPGTGSTFWIRLPVATGNLDLPDTAATGSYPRFTPDVQRQSTVLCIEDNPANMRLVERVLAQRQNIHLITATTPHSGLDLATQYLPDLILLDINLPDMDGYAVMQCLRESDKTRHIPVIAVSANAMPKDLARGEAAGFREYLTKPLEVNKLLKVVDEVIANVNGSTQH